MMKYVVALLFVVTLLFSACKKEGVDHDNSIFETGRVWLNYLECHQGLKESERTYYIQSYNGISDFPEHDYSQTAAAIEGNASPYSLQVDTIVLDYSNYYYSADDN